MALRELEYQGGVLARLDDYLTELAGWKTKADKIDEDRQKNQQKGHFAWFTSVVLGTCRFFLVFAHSLKKKTVLVRLINL